MVLMMTNKDYVLVTYALLAVSNSTAENEARRKDCQRLKESIDRAWQAQITGVEE